MLAFFDQCGIVENGGGDGTVRHGLVMPRGNKSEIDQPSSRSPAGDILLIE